MNNFSKNLVLWIILFLIVISFLRLFSNANKPPREIEYGNFLEDLEAKRVDKVEIRENFIFGTYKNGERFKTYNPGDADLVERLYKSGASFSGKPLDNLWKQLMLSVLPILLFVGFFWFMIYRQMQAGGNRAFSFGKSRAKLVSEGYPKVTFKDVAGVDEAKEELEEIIEFLKNPKKFQRLGGRIPKGVLLMGPPGTGKTLLAKAVAGEAGVPFFSISGSDFVEMFVGVGASRVRDLFEQGKKHSPCLIFMDEIDAVGRQRFAGLGGGHDEREQTLNQLLAEMDGFDTKEGIILIAATNRPDVLDPALLRPGRFDRQIVVDIPDIKGREAILKVHTQKMPLAKNVNLEIIARETPGFSGADLANLVNEASLLAARRNRKSVGMKELEDAIERVMVGPERKSRVISKYEKKLVAHHESGHALLADLLPHADPVHKLSIIPRGAGALGYTLQLPTEDRYLMTKTELLEKITVLLGGRAAEHIIFGETTTGAQNDLTVATEAVRKMVCEYGMSEKVGPMTLGRRDEQVFLGRDILKERDFSEEVASEIDKEMRRIINECYQKAQEVISLNLGKLKKLASVLMEKEVLTGDEVREIIHGKKKSGRKNTRSKKSSPSRSNEEGRGETKS